MEIKAEIHFAWQPELQIRGSIEDNSKMIILISQRKHVVTPR